MPLVPRDSKESRVVVVDGKADRRGHPSDFSCGASLFGTHKHCDHKPP